MKTRLLWIWVAMLQVAGAVGDPAWLSRTEEKMDHIEDLPVDQQIKLLGSLAAISAEKMDEEQRQVAQRAQSMVIAIPGHADYYANRIKAERRAVDEERARGEIGYSLSKLLNEQMYGFQALGSMPSPETVRVLGEFLYDDEGARPKGKPPDPDHDNGEHSNASEAVEAITRLPIVSKPTPVPWNRIYDDKRDSVTHAWQLWYEQVKAGNRTFRFEGDPTEYNLQGPVSVSKDPNGPQRRETLPRAASPVASVERSHFSGLLLLTSLGAVGLGAWYTYRSRKVGR